MPESKSFWDHLDDLRQCLIRVIVAVAAVSVVLFLMKDELFGVILYPTHADFPTYRLMDQISGTTSVFDLSLINTHLAAQFAVHMQMSIVAALIVVCPYILYEVFCFVSPALYADERRHTIHFCIFGYVMFAIGLALAYMLIFPLTIRFLGDYQVSDAVVNTITLESYIDVMIILLLSMGIICELPVLCLLFARVGLLSAAFMRQYRRHAVVLILVVAAIITPTSDAITLSLVSLPIYLLFEFSILLVSRVKRG